MNLGHSKPAFFREVVENGPKIRMLKNMVFLKSTQPQISVFSIFLLPKRGTEPIPIQSDATLFFIATKESKNAFEYLVQISSSKITW